MSDRTTLLALAERSEQAVGPDRVLDAEIMCAFYGYTIHKNSNPAEGHFSFWEGEPEESKCVNCSGWARVTEHLDEAVTLYPVLPDLIPSCPRKASAAALRAMAAAQEEA
jgi:hypothetical protein